MKQITTLTFFKYRGLKEKIWAFGMMQFAHIPLSKVDGLSFYKLMGSGREGFNPFPDWSVYGLLQVWENEDAADVFLNSSKLMLGYKKHSEEQWTIFLKCLVSKGQWSAQNPFKRSTAIAENNPYIAVVTRATIKLHLLIKFWKYVPISQKPLLKNKGLLFTKGIGEVPIVQMATFSIWKDKESLIEFAYKSKAHRKAIEKTQKLNWYKEELFSRFQPYRSLGQWNGKNPLHKL
ncbi:MAG: DUF3291 domain-containing protein [Bacteroidota bacterium]